MEVSSHAVAQHRIEGLKFAGGIFTNLTHDHLDFHKTFSSYLKAKKAFFDQLSSSAFALSNIDDKNGMVMLQNTQAKKKNIWSKKYGQFQSQSAGKSLQRTSASNRSPGNLVQISWELQCL
jgi:UDP-N-acetylmuramoyl-L-alanyl-D-glutamate--2,6-diaminopimelate ligase